MQQPAYTVSPPVPPHPHNNIHRSWSDEHVPVNSIEPIRPAPRSSSFSASRAPQLQWSNGPPPPPPPVPPLPPSLLPGFQSPPLAHANLDFTFAESPGRLPPTPQPRPGSAASYGPHPSYGFPPRPTFPATDPTPPWPPVDQQNYFPPNSSFGPPRPAMSPWPTNGYVPNVPSPIDRRPSSYSLAQNFRNPTHSPSPPPAVPPRPTTTPSEGRFEWPPPMHLQGIPPAPPVPPKTLTSPVTSPLIFPIRDHIRTGSGQEDNILLSSRVRSVPEADRMVPGPETGSPEVLEAKLPEAEIGPPEVSEIGPTEVSEMEPPKVQDTEPSNVSETGPSEIPETESPIVLRTTLLSTVTETSESSDSDWKRALTLSLAKSQTGGSATETHDEEEDDELARAVAESLSLSAKLDKNLSHPRPGPSYSTNVTQIQVLTGHSGRHLHESSENMTSQRRPSIPGQGERDILSPEELEDHAAHGQIMQELEDEEVTRKLQEEEDQRLAAEMRERERKDEERARLDSEYTKRLQEEEAKRLEAEKRERELLDEARARMDEELIRRQQTEEKAQKLIREAQERKDADIARRMAEDSEAKRLASAKGAPPPQAPKSGPRPAGPPSYNDSVGSPRAPVGARRPAPRTVQSSPQLNNGALQQPRPGRAVSAFVSGPGRGVGDQAECARSAMVNVDGAAGPPRPAGRQGGDGSLRSESGGSRSQGPSPANGASTGSSRMSPNAGHYAASGPTSSATSGSSVSTASTTSSSSVGPSTTLSSNAGPGVGTSSNVRNGVTPEDNGGESDVYKGVSYGFMPPNVRSAPPVSQPFPEVISLLRTPCPPLHIMATSWRHLMRLLAQLETRIQANLEVIASSKEENLLRVVVQFVKLPYAANTWRTILYLTLDQPIPRNTQHAWRYTSGDTTTLPYSYTLGEPLPHLVNSATSQLYVIPLSATSPYPILPISLPNLALYIQSAMRDSRARKVQSDPSKPMGRLARIVMACYPEEVVNPDKEERKPSRGVGNLFKRVVGLGGSGNREEPQGNEDVYDIITPFRIDQYTVS